MQWLLSISGFLLSVIDGSERKANRQELAAAAKRSRAELAQVESYYDRAGEKTGRLVYFWGMLIGILVLALVAIPGALIFRLFGSYRFDDPAVRDFFVCYALGAVGAIVSVMMRMAQKSVRVRRLRGGEAFAAPGGSFGRSSAVFGVVVFLALKRFVQLQPGAESQSAYFARRLRRHFSERRAMVISVSEEGAGGSDDTGEDDSRSSPRRRANNGQTAGGPA
jgi:hypothetical protein